MQQGLLYGLSVPSRLDRVGSVFVVTGELRKCLGCGRLLTREAAAQHCPAACSPCQPGIDLYGRVIETAAQA
jgi:hypothetical protein